MHAWPLRIVSPAHHSVADVVESEITYLLGDFFLFIPRKRCKCVKLGPYQEGNGSLSNYVNIQASRRRSEADESIEMPWVSIFTHTTTAHVSDRTKRQKGLPN